MHDRVDGERQFEPHHLGGKRALAREGALVSGDVVGRGFYAVLDRDLDVIEPGLHQLGEALRRHADAGGYEVSVETGRARGASNLDEIAPRGRLPAG